MGRGKRSVIVHLVALHEGFEDRAGEFHAEVRGQGMPVENPLGPHLEGLAGVENGEIRVHPGHEPAFAGRKAGKLSGLGDFQVRGTYHGEPFSYADSSGRNPRPSVWNVRIEVPPQRELLTLWWDSTEYAKKHSAGAHRPPPLASRQA